jgi:hypothetical protein
MTGLDSTPASASFTRNAALDVPGYEAYAVQEDALDRFFIALAAESADGSVQASAVSDGGQFARFYAGTSYARSGGFDRPPVDSSGQEPISKLCRYLCRADQFGCAAWPGNRCHSAHSGRHLALGGALPARAARQDSLTSLRELQEAAQWRSSARFSLTPSSNVNAGADSRYNTVDGVPVTGLLSGSAQALSGTIATLKAEGNRRLMTRPGGQFFWMHGSI